MAKSSKLDQLGDRVLKALLEKHACPLRLHELRARFMGNIATPDFTASPMQEVNRIWGGQLPEFESEEDAELLMTGLMGGLWNPLSKHQSKSNPFRLTRVKSAPASYDYLAKLSKFRRQEIDAFIEGLFAGKDYQEFPKRAHDAIENLSEIRSIVAGAHELCACPPAPASRDSLEDTKRGLRDLMVAAEKEMNVVIQSCKEARASHLETYAFDKPPTVH